MTIKNNIEHVLENIKKCANNSSRNPEDIGLIAVTKTIDIDTIKEAIEYGITDIGENKVQELITKYEEIGPAVKWHLIGHLQRNKVKYIIDKVDFIHSLDSYRLGKEINKRAKAIDRTIECLVQVNVSGEDTKFGVSIEELKELLNKLNTLNNIKVVGLMTMAPHVEDKEETRQYFKTLKDLSDEVAKLDFKNIEMKYLSMGMSNDFEVAVEEGANFVRVGSKIFGKRDYSK